MVRGGEAGTPEGPGGRPTASGKTNPSPGRGGPGVGPPQVAKSTPAPVVGIRGAVPPQVAKPTPAPVGGVRGVVPPQVAKPTPAPVGGVRGVVPPQVAKPTPAPIVGVRGVVPPDRYCGPTAQLANPASMGRRPGHPSDRSPSRRQRARGTPLSTGRPGPSWVQPPAGPDRCPFPVLRLALRRGHAESPAARSLAWVASIVPASQPGAGLRSNLPLISAMSTPVMMIDSPGDSPSPGDTIDPPRRVRQSALFIRPERRFQREDRR